MIDAKLVVVSGHATRNEIRLKLPMTIGRVKEAGLSIAHPMVSRLHCKLLEVNETLVIEDNRSANGTFVNDRRITRAVLQSGDKLTIGPLTFVAIVRNKGGAVQVAKPASDSPFDELFAELPDLHMPFDNDNVLDTAPQFTGEETQLSKGVDPNNDIFNGEEGEPEDAPAINLSGEVFDLNRFFQTLTEGEDSDEDFPAAK